VALKIDRIEQFGRAARLLGRVVGDSARGDTVADTVLATVARVRAATAGRPRPRAVWPLVGDPLYVAGAGSFLSELLDAAGATNVFADLPQPSPQVSREEVLRRDADLVVTGPAGCGAAAEGARVAGAHRGAHRPDRRRRHGVPAAAERAARAGRRDARRADPPRCADDRATAGAAGR
jgi:ABC-type hemin transport system substrate-binding protein